MTTSSVRITRTDTGDVTQEYVNLYRSGKPLSRLTAGLGGTPLSTSLARIAHDGKVGGDDGEALDDATFETVRDIALAGHGTFTTPNGWTVTVTDDTGRLFGSSTSRDSIYARSVFTLDRSPVGNTVLRVGRVLGDGSWTQTEHVALDGNDRRALVAALLEDMDPVSRRDLLDEVIDTESSNSRQHFIDTGAYLTRTEAAAARA